jgi:hypothetical protein
MGFKANTGHIRMSKRMYIKIVGDLKAVNQAGGFDLRNRSYRLLNNPVA